MLRVAILPSAFSGTRSLGLHLKAPIVSPFSCAWLGPLTAYPFLSLGRIQPIVGALFVVPSLGAWSSAPLTRCLVLPALPPRQTPHSFGKFGSEAKHPYERKEESKERKQGWLSGKGSYISQITRNSSPFFINVLMKIE